MSNPNQQQMPTLNERFRDAHNDYIGARTSALECIVSGQLDEAQVWATLAVAASNVLAEPVPHCSKCCY